jgi:hypothetical protein
VGAGIAQRLTADEVTTGEVGDRERIAVATISKHGLALVIGAPEIVRLGRDRQRSPLRFVPSRSAVINKAIANAGGIDSANGEQCHVIANPPAQILADFGSTPACVLALDREDLIVDLKG